MALPVNINDLINARTVESVKIEFKKGWNPEEVIQTVCAFANDIKEYGGGYIIIGVEEKDGIPVLPPHGLNQNQIDPIQKEFIALCFKIRPNIFPIIEPIELEGKHLLIIWVTTGEERPYSAPSTLGAKGQNRIYARPASVTIPATPALEDNIRELATYKHFDDRVNTKANLGDLDLGLMLSYLQEIKSLLYDEATKMTFEELCLKMQIARGPKENIKPLNVGLLLFSKSPHKHFEGCRTNLVEFENEAGTVYSPKTFEGPVHIQIRQIMEYLNSTVIKNFVSKRMTRTEAESFYNYPYRALREAVVNALYHRSYENPTPNEIRIYKHGRDRRIEILSYPGPLPPIDDQALVQLKITARNYRNIKLGDWLKNIRLAEKFATGIPTILDSLNANGSPKPILSTDAEKSHFLVVLKIHPDTPVEADQSSHEIERIILSDIQQNILELLLNEPIIDSELLKNLKSGSQAEIEFLVTKALIGVKQLDSSKLFYVTQKGIEALKNSF